MDAVSQRLYRKNSITVVVVVVVVVFLSFANFLRTDIKNNSQNILRKEVKQVLQRGRGGGGLKGWSCSGKENEVSN